MAEILQPKPDESIYDPTCGSGGMLIKSLTYLKDHGKEWRGVQVYGQEVNNLTAAIARMNLYLHGIVDFSIANADTLKEPAFTRGDRLQQFDVVLANPPYSIKNWDRAAFQHDAYGRNILGTPPQSKADYAFIQHIIASMDQHHGRCAILLPHGVLNRLIERDLRKKLLEIDVVEAVISVGKNLFFNSPMEACILICRNNKSIERHGKILMIKATDLVERKNTESYLTEDHIRLISDIYTNYKEEEYRSVIVDVSTIDPKTYSISPKLYVKSQSQETEDADDLFAVWDDMTDSLHKDIDSLTKLFS